jgi:hypothetical protein
VNNTCVDSLDFEGILIDFHPGMKLGKTELSIILTALSSNTTITELQLGGKN